MAYTPTVWVSNPDHDDPVLTPTYLNKIETGIKDAHDLASGGGLTAGAGLAYSSPSVLAVGAGSNIVVNADDVALAASPSVTAITASQNNATAITLSGAGGGLTIGGDTNLYRAAANQLQTDDSLIVAGTALYAKQLVSTESVATNTLLWSDVTGDTNPRLQADHNGKIVWGPGNAPGDTNLYRSAPYALKTDAGLVVTGDIYTNNGGGLFGTVPGPDKRGLLIDGDTNLYRAAADTLKTDDKLYVVGDAYAQQGNAGQMRAGAAGPSSKPGLTFGSSEDTNLYRDTTNSLKTDDTFTAPQVVVGSNPGMAFASGTLASRPTATTANAGLMYLATDTAVIYISSGAAWVRLSEPAGLQAAFAGATAPTGWVFATGTSVLRTGIYADLFAQIGTTYGSADGSHFNLPDLRGRVPVGLDDMGDGAGDGGRLTGTAYDALGEAGGSQTVTLTGAQSGTSAHKHSADGDASPLVTATGDTYGRSAYHQHAIGYNFYGVTAGGSTIAVPDANNTYSYNSQNDNTQHTHGIPSLDVTGNTGTTSEASASQSHDNMPPFILQKWAIRL